MSNVEEFIQDLKKVKIFLDATDVFFHNMSAHVKRITADKGKILFVNGDEALRFFFIKSGYVKLYRETLDGAQAVVDIKAAGNLFGETSFITNSFYSCSAEVVEKSEILSFPLSLLKKEVETNPRMSLSMLSSMAQYNYQQDKELEHRTLQNAPQRIGCFLLKLIKHSEENFTTIHLPYDKTLLASRLGMQPETFSRALLKLKDETGLRVKGATIELDDINTLIEYSCSACSSNFPCNAE